MYRKLNWQYNRRLPNSKDTHAATISRFPASQKELKGPQWPALWKNKTKETREAHYLLFVFVIYHRTDCLLSTPCTCCLITLCLSSSGSWLTCPTRKPCLMYRLLLSTSCHPPQVTLFLSVSPSLSIHTAETYPVLSPSPGLFTLILAAIFPSNSSDRFTLSKLLAVALRWGLNEHYIVLHCVSSHLPQRLLYTSLNVWFTLSSWDVVFIRSWRICSVTDISYLCLGPPHPAIFW